MIVTFFRFLEAEALLYRSSISPILGHLFYTPELPLALYVFPKKIEKPPLSVLEQPLNFQVSQESEAHFPNSKSCQWLLRTSKDSVGLNISDYVLPADWQGLIQHTFIHVGKPLFWL